MSGTSNVYGGSGPAGDIYFNYTPLVDVTFNLILYFVLTSTINTQAMARVVLPMPDRSQAIAQEKVPANCVIVNVISLGENDKDVSRHASTAKEYQIDSQPIPIGDMDALIQKFKAKRELQAKLMGGKTDEFFIQVRADHRVEFAAIQPVLVAAAQAGIPKMNLAALVDTGR